MSSTWTRQQSRRSVLLRVSSQPAFAAVEMIIGERLIAPQLPKGSAGGPVLFGSKADLSAQCPQWGESGHWRSGLTNEEIQLADIKTRLLIVAACELEQRKPVLIGREPAILRLVQVDEAAFDDEEDQCRLG